MKRVTEATKIIGQNLRDIREVHGFSQAHIALQIDKTFQQVQKYENGSNRLPSEVLYTLKQFYGIPYGCFFKGMEEDFDFMSRAPARLNTGFLTLLEGVEDHELRQKIFDLINVLTAGR